MSTGTLSPVGRQQFMDVSGSLALNGGLINTYLSGTSTPTPTYTDAGLSVPNANPIVLDSAGRCVIYLDPTIGAYKYQVHDSLNNLLYTCDPVTATNAGTTGLGTIFTFGGSSVAPITATSYPAGTTGDTLIPNSTEFFQDSALLSPGTYVIEGMGQVTSGNTLTVALMDLDDGAPTVPLATATYTAQTPTLARSGSISFAAGGSAKHYGLKAIVSAGTGFAFGFILRRTA